MIFLPKGISVKENINPARVNLPESLKKLQKAGFSGYLRFASSAGNGVVLFDAGRMVSVLRQEGAGVKRGAEALTDLFEFSMEGRMALHIYRLSSPLVARINGLLQAPARYRDQEVKLIDFRGLLTKLKSESFSGGILVYADERVALIFYEKGEPLGFFNDGSGEIETTADLSMSVARLPGARITLLNAPAQPEAAPSDLLETVDPGALWLEARSRVARRMKARQSEIERKKALQEEEIRQKVLAFLKDVASRHLGKMGVALAEKEFEKALGEGRKVSAEVVEEFCRGIARTAKLVAGPSTVNAMLLEIRSGAAKLL